jgi:hypothetical protein
VAVTALVAMASPAEAKKQNKGQGGEAPIQDIDNGEPMIIVVSTGQQKIDIYRGTKLVTSSVVSTGTAAHPTMLGAFSILEKQRYHHSNIYSGAPMPWMNRITWSGTALHAGVVPGYPASHGCIRLLYSFAPKLFQITTVGDNVVVSKGRPAPTPISHPALFQPTPLSKVAELTVPLRTGGAPLPAIAAAAASPVILAKADVPSTVDSDSQGATAAVDTASQGGEAGTAGATHARPDIAPDPFRVHAITRDAGNATKAEANTDPSLAPATNVGGGASDEEKSAVAVPSPAPVPSPQPVATLPATAAKVDAGAVAAATQAASSEATAKLEAGIVAAAIQAAEPRSEAPLRILFTRRTKRDRIIGFQQTLAELGYLEPQNFDGSLGKATVKALKAFQKDNGLPETGAFDEDLVKKVYEKAGKGEPPAGHLFVRQAYVRVFDTPVDFRDPDQPLGTHVYTALKFGPKDTRADWVGLDVQDDQGVHPLDRIKIPEDVRQKISERLTPGSTFIVADTAINSANLNKGNDFVVLAKATSSFKISDAVDDAPKVKKKRRRGYSSRSYGLDDYGYGDRGRSSRRNYFFGGRNGVPWW